ncbi:FAD-dependent oxidoreductase [Gordonia neofelifaecis]|uniref:3-oxosteroid 1-dehydrogenase n=1 Tax=Gordonia neofelifaecis NRRL B-59395 TaxID=644548 RepID=F1YPF2_9ACTN|nr:FAD-dependent oxidoreductase [Gordonia neofelifaecis]EGD53403.1 3-ketosteroid-delta-1-dehydrogenase [Gordonia neofelifaecis NRRL B-59395]
MSDSQNPQWDDEYDVVVVGSGAGGMTAALTAADRGLKALIVEKADVYGGSTALSGGGVWVPNNPTLRRIGIVDDPKDVRKYLDSIVGDKVPSANLDAYIDQGPKMIELLERNKNIKFQWCTGYADYHPENPGGRPAGRSIEPSPVNSKKLGVDQAQLRPAALATPPGLYITQKDFVQLNMVARTWKARRTAFLTGLRAAKAIVLRQKMETLGQALIVRLRLALKDTDVKLWLSSPMESLITDASGAVTGVEVRRGGTSKRIRATRGVILASGGFEFNQEMRDKFLPEGAHPNFSAAAESNTGDGILAGEAVGAAVSLMDDAWWMPSMQTPKGVNQVLVSERSVPRAIIVDQHAQRFTNEASPYVTFTHDQLEGRHEPTWFIFDAVAKKRYQIGGIMPGQKFPKSWLSAGLIRTADTIEELAGKIDLDPATLRGTVDRFNDMAAKGHDDDFNRGDSAYDRYYGDPTLPNPVLDSIDQGPYYALQMRVGDLGTKGGLVYNENAQVLREDDTVIEGLYATGNTSAAVMGNEYAGPGATIGPAMTFGYIAANHAADAKKA